MFEIVWCYIVEFTINSLELSHSFQRSVLDLESTEPFSTEDYGEEQFFEETTGPKKNKTNIAVIAGSLSACLVVIIVVVIVLWKYVKCKGRSLSWGRRP